MEPVFPEELNLRTSLSLNKKYEILVKKYSFCGNPLSFFIRFSLWASIFSHSVEVMAKLIYMLLAIQRLAIFENCKQVSVISSGFLIMPVILNYHKREGDLDFPAL